MWTLSYLWFFFCQEFDRQESKKVQELFDAIDVILYENSASGPSHLCHECSEWTSRFPHLRYNNNNNHNNVYGAVFMT